MSSGAVLVVGASRGIGAELVRQYLSAGYLVHATVRDVSLPGELAGIDGDLVLHQLDVRNEGRVAELAKELSGSQLAIAIHNAGIGRGHSTEDLKAVNSVAPIRLVDSLLSAGAVRRGGVVAIMTSQMGARKGSSQSLGDYGESKAALNDRFRMRSHAWGEHGVIAVVVHPGWVRTDMGGEAAPLSVAESATGMRSLFAGLTPADHGRFWTWDGREHPW
jgi:NAD(P)-dependent dehydrogenase (short-subunit alcohol dehydrogenase family)